MKSREKFKSLINKRPQPAVAQPARTANSNNKIMLSALAKARLILMEGPIIDKPGLTHQAEVRRKEAVQNQALIPNREE